MRCSRLPAVAVGLVSVLSATARAQIYSSTPDWQSADMQVSTGGALVDLNRDGWLDLVVSNGNDISKQRVVVYYGAGTGTLQTAPGWQSNDTAYNGHLDVADVNGDGWPDVAVGVLLPGVSEPLRRRVSIAVPRVAHIPGFSEILLNFVLNIRYNR